MKSTTRNPLLLILTGTLVACGGNSNPTPANTPPTVSVKSDGRAITTSTYLRSGGTVQVAVSDPDVGGSITKVTYTIDGGTATTLTPAASITLPIGNLTGGQHELALSATDNQNATTSIKVPFLIDAAAPIITQLNLNGQAADATTTYTIGDAVLLDVTARDTRGDTAGTTGPITAIRVYENGTLVKSGSGATLNVDLSKATSGQARAAGTSVITVEAEDSVGFVTTRTLTLTFNAATDNGGVVAPTFTWLSPASDFVKGGGTVVLRATATRNGQDLSSQIVYTATCGSITGDTWTLDTNCADGSKQSVTATVTDGGRSFSSPAKIVTVDASDPTVQITSPQQGQTFTQNPIKISVTGTDAVSGLDRILVEASKDGVTYTQIGVVTAASGDVVWAPMNGTYTIRATATDKTGRTNSTTVSGVRVNLTSSDTTPPSVTLAPIPATPQRATITVTATAIDSDSGVAKVDLYDGGTLITSNATGINGKYTFSVDTTKLSDGAHTLRAVAFDNAGQSAETTANLTVDNAAPVVNWISPADGAVTRGTVTLNATSNEGTVTYTVDGSTITGNTVTFQTDGTHTITATAQDAAGNRTTSTIKVTSDATAPTAQITSPSSGSTLTSNPITISAAGNDSGSGVSSLEVFANGTSIGTISGASGTVTWTPTSGTYDLTVIATDRAGNKGVASAPVNVTVKLATADTTAPAFVGTATVQPAPTATFSRGVITLDGFVKDPESGISQVALFNGGVRLTATPSLSLQPDGSTRYALTLDSKTLADGTYTLTVQATNGVGLVSNQDVSVKIDNTAPTLNWNAPTTVGSAGTITLNATTETGATITYAASCGTITGTTWTYGDCQDGTAATLTATATDAAGNTTTQTRTITVDRTAPTVQITSPTQGQKFTQNPITIAVSGTDNVAVDHIDVFDGTTKIGTVTGGQGTVTWAAPNGNQTLTARAYDRAGNVTETQISFTVALTTSDTTAPTGAVTTPAGDLRGQTTVSVTASDTDSGVATVSLYVDGLLSSTQTTGIAGTYTFPVDTTKLSEGQHAITAVITDNAGNTFATPSVTARVNNAAPTVTITNPQNGALLGGASDAAVKAIASDPTPGDTITLEYSVDSGAFSTSVPTLPKQDGTHTVTVRAVDAAGNSSTATTTYTYDGTAPTVQITSPTQGQLLTSAPVTISVIGQDGGTGLASINVYANDGTSPDELIGTLRGNGSVTWYPRKTDGTPYTIRAVATDRAGNPSIDTTSPGATVTGVRVKTASTITVTGGPTFSLPNADPKGGLHTANGRTYVRGPLVVNATATTDATMTQADLQADGQTLQTTTTTPANPTFNFDFDALNEGLRDVAVRFTDSLGTVAATKTTVFVDKTAPIITWNTPLNGSLTNAPVTLNATATDSASGTNGTVTFTENGQPVTAPVSADGQHTVTATAIDNVGNVGTRNITFTIDATAPEVIPALPDSPTNPQEFTTAPVTLTATATDALSGVTSIEVLVAPQGQPLTTLGRQSGSNYSAVYTPAQAGLYDVKYIARDAAGNSVTTSRLFRYSVTTPPVEKAPAPVLEVVGSGPYSGNMSVNVSGNFDTASQVDRMILQVTDSKGVIDNSTYVTTQARATFSVDTTRFANGPLTLQVIAYTKSGLPGKSAETTVQVQNLTSPDFKVSSPSDGAVVTTPSVPVQITLTKRSADYTITQPIQVDLLDYRGVRVAGATLNPSDPATCSGNTESLTCNTSFDVAALPADTYLIRARTTVQVDPAGANITRPLETSSRFTHNTTSVLPPASTIRFPAITDLQKPGQLDSSSGLLVSVSDNTGVAVVEARVVGPFDATRPLTLNGTTQCDASVLVPGRSPVDVLMLNYGYNPAIVSGDVVLNNLDIDGSAYVPDNNVNERYDLRVTVQDTEGNRNIQCIPVTINRAAIRAARPAYATATATTPTPPSTVTGELNYTTGTWSLSGMTNRSRAAAVLYMNGVQKSVSFTNDVTGSVSSTVSFGEPGTYQVVWLVEDMTTGVVTSVAGSTISVIRNP
ncbi:beta strand repeat-containing protein [Deinococcus daejeonensis]|uniref:PKD/Chitinase domain-containing protein n=1 Tax=Deinococcus daejeonensis TaxID=1007098 RepID=A0ABQ2JC33_9DEIO|nr:Ig-like domain-containing protein [Deinococcus daejeonensis]GGN43559.1 hypothetical protein GCM10010842_31150 [Deinococcus daejeonensis]